jgi:hypothetical protein
MTSPVIALVLTLMAIALVVLGGVVLQQRERLASLEQRLEHEMRQREQLALLVERLQDPAAGLEPAQASEPTVHALLRRLGKPGLKH